MKSRPCPSPSTPTLPLYIGGATAADAKEKEANAANATLHETDDLECSVLGPRGPLPPRSEIAGCDPLPTIPPPEAGRPYFLLRTRDLLTVREVEEITRLSNQSIRILFSLGELGGFAFRLSGASRLAPRILGTSLCRYLLTNDHLVGSSRAYLSAVFIEKLDARACHSLHPMLIARRAYLQGDRLTGIVAPQPPQILKSPHTQATPEVPNILRIAPPSPPAPFAWLIKARSPDVLTTEETTRITRLSKQSVLLLLRLGDLDGFEFKMPSQKTAKRITAASLCRYLRASATLDEEDCTHQFAAFVGRLDAAAIDLLLPPLDARLNSL